MVEKWNKASYEMVARTIRSASIPRASKDELALEFTRRFSADNPRFDRDRFSRAVASGEVTRPSTAKGGQWTRQTYQMVADVIRTSNLKYTDRIYAAVAFSKEFEAD